MSIGLLVQRHSLILGLAPLKKLIGSWFQRSSTPIFSGDAALVLLGVIAVVFFFSAIKKASSKSRADGIFKDWLKNSEVDERLRCRTIALLNNMETVERLLAQARQNHPDRSEQ